MLMVIAIVGHPSAGKDVAANYLAAKGFQHVSSGNIIRELMHERNIPTDRTQTHAFVREMRALHGNRFPAEEIVRRITGNAVVSGLRNLSAVDFLNKHFGRNFLLLAIDAPVELRYARALARKRPGDVTSFEQFKKEEDRERRDDVGAHEMDKVLAAADMVIENNGTAEAFFKNLDELLVELKVRK